MHLNIYGALDMLFRIIEFLIFARVLLSWIPIGRDSRLVALIYQLTEPILAPIREIIERSAFGKNMIMDFSPIIALFLLDFIRIIVRAILSGLIR